MHTDTDNRQIDQYILKIGQTETDNESYGLPWCPYYLPSLPLLPLFLSFSVSSYGLPLCRPPDIISGYFPPTQQGHPLPKCIMPLILPYFLPSFLSFLSFLSLSFSSYLSLPNNKHNIHMKPFFNIISFSLFLSLSSHSFICQISDILAFNSNDVPMAINEPRDIF